MSIATAETADAGGIECENAADAGLRARRIWLAPICLCLVAALHLYRVTTAGQTPWKGGGFGMFSTIDSEAARFVHAYVRTHDGMRPIHIPSELDKRIAELRAAPNQQLATELAKRLAQRSWFDPQLRQAQLAEQLRAQPHYQPMTAELLREMRRATNNSLASTSTTNILSAADAEFVSHAIPFDLVRVEVWKQTMRAGTTQLEPRLLFFSVCPVPEKK